MTEPTSESNSVGGTFTPPTITTTTNAGDTLDGFPGVRINPPRDYGPPAITYPPGWHPLVIRDADTVRIAPTPEGGIKLTIDGPRWTAAHDTPEDTP